MTARAGALTLAVLIAAGVGLRGYNLGEPTLWVDEAESAINAITIVGQGVPVDTYLGAPIFENALLREWPGHPELEFRDLSYSDRGLAVYHSWLPLYSIAAAFRLAGVTPEQARSGALLSNATHEQMAWWTAVPRLPALVFSALFIAAAWSLGRAFAGAPAAVAAGTAAATANFFVFAGRQARYYASALAVDAACGLAIWRAWRGGRRRDHVLVGVAIGLLFHVHSVSAVAMTAVYDLSAPLGDLRRGLLARLVAAGVPATLLIVPWAMWSGLLHQAVKQPMALSYLDTSMWPCGWWCRTSRSWC